MFLSSKELAHELCLIITTTVLCKLDGIQSNNQNWIVLIRGFKIRNLTKIKLSFTSFDSLEELRVTLEDVVHIIDT